MDFIDRVRELAGRVKQLKERPELIGTEEATKNGLVMPFINNVLEYNVFDPTEVVPEFTADVGTKKGEKVDYAVLKDGKPIILFECKRVGVDLDKEQASQLYRYFSVTEARFGVLTDGILYRFFSDLEQPNKMDAKPFLEFNLLEFDDAMAGELKKFSKSSFEIEQILATASDLKYTKEIMRILSEQLASPSEEFVRFFVPQVYSGRMNKAVMQQFGQITWSAFRQFINDRISDRLKSALAQEQPTQSVQSQPPEAENEEQKAVTTEDELQGYYIVKAILREVVDAKRVAMRDQQSYCAILLDDNNRKPICRLHFNSARKRLGLFDQEKHEQLVQIDNLDDIYKFADRLKAAAAFNDKTSP